MTLATAAAITSKQSFASLALREALLNNLVFLKYDEMMPIQAQSLPAMLNGQDVIAQAKTGSGKTAAFGLSLLNSLDVDNYAVQALVLCPTRELADQVGQALRQLARLMPNVKILNLSGGILMKSQIDSLRHNAHIIVGTPGRLQKHLDRKSLSLNKLKTLILDEADRMLDMGFFDAINEIISQCPKERQTLLFSATYPAEIQKISNKFMQNPKRVIIEQGHTELDIQQVFYEVHDHKDKFQLLKDLLLHHKPVSTLIFCNTKDHTTQLSAMLRAEGYNTTAINGDFEQVARDTAMILFKNLSCSILVATDVAARGLDIKDLPAVINFDLAFEPEVHIHRIGRTGRAGCKGLAISFACPEDAERLSAIEEGLGHPVNWGRPHELNVTNKRVSSAEMVTLCLSAGRKDKLRPGDILGALTKDAGIDANLIGKIDITATHSYVAVHKTKVHVAFNHILNGKVKNRKIHVRRFQ